MKAFPKKQSKNKIHSFHNLIKLICLASKQVKVGYTNSYSNYLTLRNHLPTQGMIFGIDLVKQFTASYCAQCSNYAYL